MSIKAVTAHERRALYSGTATLFILGLTLALSLYALYRGAVHREAAAASVRTFIERNREEATKARDRLVDVEKGRVDAKDHPWAGLAMNFSPTVTARPGVLADFAIGVSDIQPSATTVSQWRTIDRLFANYEFESPVAIAAGPFDLSFVVIFLFPLVMIVLAYDSLSDERESGRLGLLLSQPLSVRSLVFAKLRVRLGAVFGIFFIASIAGLAFGASDSGLASRLPRFAVWTTIGALYLSLWAALIAWIVSLNRRSETAILAMAAAWALNGLVGPALLAAAAESLYPAPSRLEYLSEVRSAASEAYKARSELTQGLAIRHPELAVDDYSLPEYIRTAFVVTQTVDRKVDPIIEGFDQAHAARLAFLRRIQYVSPAVVALQAFNEAAGSSLDRQKRFEREARAYKRQLSERLGRKVLSGQRLSVDELDGMPAFSFAEAPLSAVLRQVAFPAGFLALLAIVFGLLARRNLGRLQTRIRER